MVVSVVGRYAILFPFRGFAVFTTTMKSAMLQGQQRVLLDSSHRSVNFPRPACGPQQRRVSSLQCCAGPLTASCSGRELRPARVLRIPARPTRIGRASTVQVSAVFEKFTERSIKAVLVSQAEARILGSPEVGAHWALSQHAVPVLKHCPGTFFE